MKLFGKLGNKKQQEVSLHSGPLTESSIQQWLVDRIAGLAKVKPEDVDVARPLADFGLDSIQLFGLSSDLEKFLGQKVSEVVAWDFPTIALLAKHLSNSSADVTVSSNAMVPEQANW
ncbi:MAG TPA: acyl carrier protein [Terriglobales bacterium]|jgi:acyl carrier protein|nr:acyl carrier protein [Terriglobales bacterium]